MFVFGEITPVFANAMDGRPKKGSCASTDCRQYYRGEAGGGPAGGGDHPCAADFARLCASAGADPSARKNCMRQHRSELSPACLVAARARQGR
jgi:hypothetical protein